MVSAEKRKQLLGFRAMVSGLIDGRLYINKVHVLQRWQGSFHLSQLQSQSKIAVASSYFLQHQQSQAWASWRATWRATIAYRGVYNASLIRQSKAGIRFAWKSISDLWNDDATVLDTVSAIIRSETSCRMRTFTGGSRNFVLVEEIETEMELTSTSLEWYNCDYAEGIHRRESSCVQFGAIELQDITAVVQTSPLDFIVHACPRKPDSVDRHILKKQFTAVDSIRSAQEWVSIIYNAAGLEEQLRPPILICMDPDCHAGEPIQDLCALLALAGIEYSVHQFKFGSGGEAVARYFHEACLHTLRGGIVCVTSTDNFVNQVLLLLHKDLCNLQLLSQVITGLLSRTDARTAMCIPIALLPVEYYNGKLAHSLGVGNSLEATLSILKSKASRIDIVSVTQHLTLHYCVAASFSWHCNGRSDDWFSPDKLKSFQILEPSLLQGESCVF